MMEETTEDAEPSKEQILADLREDLIAFKKGTLETRPIEDILNEL